MAQDRELDGATPSTNDAPPRRTGGRLPHHVIEAAGVSRRTFYDHFDNKEEAFPRAGFDEAPEGLPVPALAAETAIGGAYEVVYSLILQGRTAELPALLQIVLLPFVGAQTAPDEATAVRRKQITWPSPGGG